MNMPVKQAKPLSRRALAAALARQKRAEAVLAPQRPALTHRAYENFLRTGHYDTLGTEH